MTIAQRLQRFVVREPATGCWLWTGSLTRGGYGQIRMDGRLAYVHRVSYALEHGDVPSGLTIDHLCRVRNCVNPAHLEPVTHQENMRRARRTTCGCGREYDAVKKDGHRRCRHCDSRRAKAWRKRQEGVQ